MTRNLVPALLLLTLLSFNAAAATLFGRVIEVNDGDVITVFNLNRPVRIKLLAVDAPESSQAFGDVAKKHLSELVYDKSVVVEYSGIAPDGSLVGRVTLNDADIGAQMIRDGAAWFDVSNQDRLSATDREVYQQSELAARTEKRGLWQAENPIAPWEFVRARDLRRNPSANLNSVTPGAKAKPAQPRSELNSMTLLARGSAPAAGSATAPPSEATMLDSRAAWAEGGPARKWVQFKPEGENFSALVPEHGGRVTMPIRFGEHLVDLSVYSVRDGTALYGLLWLTGPSYGESDLAAIDGSVQAFLKGLARGYEDRNSNSFSCELKDERPFSANGFSGSDFDLPSCTIPGKIRAFTRVVNGMRQLYIGSVFYYDNDAKVAKFMQNFTVGTASKAKHAAQ